MVCVLPCFWSLALLSLLPFAEGTGLAADVDAAENGGVLSSDDECVAGDGAGECSVNALQRHAATRHAVAAAAEGAEAEAVGQAASSNQGLSDAAVAALVGSSDASLEEGCHDVGEKEYGACTDAIAWAKNEGLPAHPDWYPGLTVDSPFVKWQYASWNTTHPTCPRPCSSKADNEWCNLGAAPNLWKPKMPGTSQDIKILSYNLYWWNLFKIHGGGGAQDLIKRNSEHGPFDVIGLQECEKAETVFGPPGLTQTYTAFDGDKALCMAYRTKAWRLLAHGQDEVAEDMRTEYYGRRGAQWMRLQSYATGLVTFFVNHHGPLSVNSGGACGGAATAHQLLKLITTNGRYGDTVVLVGDFNANAASRTIQEMWSHMLQVQNSVSFGGVDNIFSNVERSAVVATQDLGTGGSDHHAISATLRLGMQSSAFDVQAQANVAVTVEPTFAVENLAKAKGSDGCLIEPNTMYAFPKDGPAEYFKGVGDARICCRVCMTRDWCKGWTWTEWASTTKGSLCTIKGKGSVSSHHADGFVSGLPHGVATDEAGSRAVASK